ncbi:hypothetical protein NVV78_10460, partial [Pediococcus ethanolidurans]|uniref:hypothetical protein n=1 Tax=Pediococcus ethanolidurans TaxID=319653 RepID=UPI0021E960E3
QQQFTNINGQLESKVSKDTYDVLADTVSQTSTLAKQNQNALVSKADSNTVDVLKQRVSTAENTLTQTATKTALEQTKTDVDNINNTVQTNTSDITAQGGKIDGLLSTTSKLGDQYTNLSGQFKLSSKQLTTTMSKVDAVARGGRNLILNSADLSNFSTWTANGSKPTVSADGHEMTIVTKHGGLNINSVNLSKDLPNIGDTVTISVEAKGTATLQFNYNNGDNYVGFQNFTISDDYKRYSAQLVWNPVAGTNQNFVIFTADSTDTTLVIKHPQIEISSIAHDWSPAPEDQATVTALTQVKQTAEGASQLSKDNQGNILALQSTAKGLQTSVSNAATKDQLDILSDTFSNKISSATSAANSKMIQTINNVGIGFKNPDGTTFQMNLSADGTALLDFSKIMLNGQTNIQAATIGNAQIANGAITNAKIANLAVGTAQIGDGAITNAKIGNVDAGKITTGILDASHLNVDDVIANVINGKTITGITINTPTLNLGDNGILTGTYSVADSTSYFQPINGTGKLDISHGYIQSTANLIYYNKIMRGMANSWGYWKDSVTFVPEAHLTIGNTAESTLTAGFLKLDIFDQAKTHVVSRAYVDGTGLYINSGGTEAVSSMLSDFELLSSGRAYLMGGVNVPKSEIITIGNLQINGYHTIASNDGRDVYFKKASPKGSAPVGIHAKSFTKYSQLSIKTDISDLPADEATRMLNSIDVEKYRYTSDDATYKYQYGAIIDDINELGNKQYSLPAELLSEDGTGINMDSMTGILIKTVQDQNKKIGELSMRLTRLEMA